MQTKITILDAVRNATRSLHEQTEKTVHSHAMMCTDYDLESYAAMLLAQYNFHLFLETKIKEHPDLVSNNLIKWNERIKTDYIQQDLELLGLWPVLPLEWDNEWHDSTKGDGILGFLYVSEGSMNGAFHILRALEKNPAIANTKALHFYTSYREKSRTLWTDFLLYLQKRQEHINQNEVVLGAETAFYLFQKAYTEIENSFTAKV